jgi:NAD+---dinitrogen-reductase ADP-D-ribosyltransferase
MDDNRQNAQEPFCGKPGLPASASIPFNRCNLPAVLLGSTTYQSHPIPLEIDGIRPLHQDLFVTLAGIDSHAARAQRFMDYMTVQFRLEHLEDAGLEPDRKNAKRVNANYLRMVRGWSFDSDGREGAVLKSWVETRFGLLAHHHTGPLGDGDSEARRAYMQEAAEGIYATNAIEAQLDLLYTYCQYELARQHPSTKHLALYRGINRIDEHEILERQGRRRYRVMLNNLNSFTASRERADEFGDYILETVVPLPKIFFFNQLLPGMLKGEDEMVVIGGVYEVGIGTL